MNNKKIAIIIGAGPAGLTSAYELLNKSDIHPIILESSNLIGGISKTFEYHGNHIDIGGHRFFSKSEEITSLWSQILPPQSQPSKDDKELDRKVLLSSDGKDPEKEDEVMLTRNRVSRILYLNRFFDYPISLKFKTFSNMGFKRTFKAGFGYIGSCFHKRKEDSLENFYINRFGKPLYQMFFEKYTEKVWGRHPSKIDASWGAQRVKGLSLWKTLCSAIVKPFKRNKNKVETSLIESFSYPKFGPGQLYTTMANKIIALGGEIIFNSKVDRIILENNNIKAVIANGIEYKGDYFISSMPIKDLISSIGKDNVKEEIYEIANGLLYRDFITVGLLCNKLKLVNKTKIKTINNIIPDTWIYIQEENVKIGRLQIFNNWSPYMCVDNNKYVWIGLEYFANEGDELWNMDDSSFISMAIKELEKINVLDPKEVVDSCRFKVEKAYPAYFGSYEHIDKVISYLNSIQNLYCIGRNGQHRYNNMDHSMLTAIEAVKTILSPKDYPKENLWKVNTEKEYHETKK